MRKLIILPIIESFGLFLGLFLMYINIDFKTNDNVITIEPFWLFILFFLGIGVLIIFILVNIVYSYEELNECNSILYNDIRKLIMENDKRFVIFYIILILIVPMYLILYLFNVGIGNFVNNIRDTVKEMKK